MGEVLRSGAGSDLQPSGLVKLDDPTPPRSFDSVFTHPAVTAAGDLETLGEAQSEGNSSLYPETLDALTSWAEQRQENLAALVSRISKGEGLRSSARLAQLMIEAYKKSPDRRSTIEMIHIAALSDDLHWFEKAVDSALNHWRAGAAAMSAKELGDVIESEYWVLAPEATNSGSGYILRLKLADVRRELAAATPDR